MGTRDPRVDAYIEQAQPFAQPVLRHLRELVHRHCADIVETIKWGFPHFDRGGIVCSMAAFKQHCAFGFWKGELVLGQAGADDAMGQFGRIASLADLPPDAKLGAWIERAVELNRQGVKSPRRTPAARTHLDAVPDDLAAALAAHPAAAACFAHFAPSHRREYVEWIIEAKRPETRQRRIAQTLEWLAQGKSRNWKYADCGDGKRG